MRGSAHVRFGGRAGETDQPEGRHRAPARPHYWAADILAECGAELHLAHPLGMKGITSRRRVKNDVKDAVLLADLLRLGSLPEAWVAPPGLREAAGAGPLPGQAGPDP